MVIWYVLCILFLIYFFYLCCKVIWYIAKIGAFQRKLKALENRGYRIKRKRRLLSMFGIKKGLPDFSIEINGKTYDMHLLSFISTHGRWNIEKEQDHYRAEARRYNRIFYNSYNNSSDEPHFSREFRRESGFQKCLFRLPQEEVSPDDGKIVLVYPTPRLLTYTEKKLEYLKSGSAFHGYTVVYFDDLFSYLTNKEE